MPEIKLRADTPKAKSFFPTVFSDGDCAAEFSDMVHLLLMDRNLKVTFRSILG